MEKFRMALSNKILQGLASNEQKIQEFRNVFTNGTLEAQIHNHSPQSFGTWHFTLQHITHSNSHGLVPDTLIVIFAVPWMPFLANR